MQYFFIESLQIGNWLSAVWPAVRATLRRQPGATGTIFYVDGQPRAVALARRMAAGRGLRIERLAFDAAEIFDEEGVLVWQRLYYRDMRQALDCAVRQPAFRSFLDGAEDSEAMKAYVKKQALPGVTLFAGSGLWRAMYLVQVGLRKARRDGIADERVTLFLNRCPWIAAIGEYARAYGGLTVVAVGRGFRPRDTLLRLVGRDALLLREKARRLFAPPVKVSRRETATACLALQYYGHFNLDRPQSHSDFFFWQQSDFPGDRLLALFGIPKDPLDAEKQAALSRHGMRGLALRHDAAACPEAAVHAETAFLSNLGGAAKVLAGACVRARRAGWTASGWRSAARRITGSASSNSRTSRVFATWFKYNGDHCAIGEALRELGGALAVYPAFLRGQPHRADGAARRRIFRLFLQRRGGGGRGRLHDRLLRDDRLSRRPPLPAGAGGGREAAPAAEGKWRPPHCRLFRRRLVSRRALGRRRPAPAGALRLSPRETARRERFRSGIQTKVTRYALETTGAGWRTAKARD
ncbi:MAG: hypothetical protein IPG33_16650 [Betaproteobacteria bacterium]|nr:hypothetical protein [Betaproteobacteria bacterium]